MGGEGWEEGREGKRDRKGSKRGGEGKGREGEEEGMGWRGGGERGRAQRFKRPFVMAVSSFNAWILEHFLVFSFKVRIGWVGRCLQCLVVWHSPPWHPPSWHSP